MMKHAHIIVDEECEKEGITIAELWKSGRTKTVSALRQRVMQRLRAETTLSLREIGQLVGLSSKPNHQLKKLEAKETK